MAKRTPKDVIDQAVAEGRFGLVLAYGVIGLAIGGAVIGVVQALLTSEALWVVGSGLLGVFLWPALRHALDVRRQNVALRLLEIPLSQVTNADAAAKLLQDFFRESFFRKE